jgi:ribosome biogenesis GTPase
MDTPGFSSVYVPEMDERELKHYYPEFTAYEGDCKFASCMHDKEKECGVKDAVEAGLISRVRYENYVAIYEEIKNNNKY